MQEMKASQERKRYDRGCLLVLALLLASGIVAFSVDHRLWIFAAGMLIIGIVFSILHSRREKHYLEFALSVAFEGFSRCLPELRRESIYGFPSIVVRFKTKDDMIEAFKHGHLKNFRAAVASFYDSQGFDIEKGFREEYLGFEEDLYESLKTDPTGNDFGEAWVRLRELYYGSIQNHQ